MTKVRIEGLENYIKSEITERGFDKYGQIEIDFAGLGEEEEIKEAAKNLSYEIEEGRGEGVYWVYKEA